MITLDKIKIVSSVNNISNIKYDKFQSIIENGTIIEQKITIQTPYLVFIEADYQERELIIEFTGKILRDDYPQLINKTTFHQCLNNINTMGLCHLDVEAIMKDGQVVKTDVCRDVVCTDCKTLTKNLQANVRNFKKYKAQNYGGNFVIEKTAQTKSYKRRLTIYDKGKEIRKANNRDFLSTLNNRDKLLDYFDDKIRFELNLNSKEQIRQALDINDTSIHSVLRCSTTPIWNFLDDAIEDVRSSRSRYSLLEFKNMLLLQHCKNDLEKVEAIVRQHSSPNTHITQAMKPYRELLVKMSENPFSNLKEELKKLLTEEIVISDVVSI